jgi:RHS repeat-associated protein
MLRTGAACQRATARSRRTQCTDTHSDRTELNEYDTDNNLTKRTDSLNHFTTFVYDARDRKASATDRLSGATSFAYDTNNNLLTLTDAETRQTSYVYDSRNLLGSETFPDNGARSYLYDAARRLAKRTDQIPNDTSYVYDMANRLTERDYPAGWGNDTFGYDSASRLLTAASAHYNNAVTRAYDAASRLASETLTVGATPYTVSYGYSVDNLQTSVTYPNAAIVTRTFTARHQLASVSYNGNAVATHIYDDGMRLSTKTFGNDLVETRNYQTDNLVSSISTPGVTAFGYTWDANKRKTAQTETGIPVNNQTFGYDNEDRLTGFNRNNGDSQTWGLSLVGDWNNTIINGVQQNRTHDAVHELTQVDATALSYDEKGNLLTNSNGQVYTWDYENRLVAAGVPAGCPQGIEGTHTYSYDALGRRVSKTVGAATTVFVSDGLQEICEYVSSAGVPPALVRSYVYGSYIDEPLCMIVAAGENAGRYYYHANDLYSVAALTDSAGNVVERYKYNPYGGVTVLAADGVTVRSVSLYGNPWTFTGRRLDAETGLMYYRARMYSTELGRFISRDPIGYRGGIDLYEYVGGNPSDYVDPFGEEKAKCCKKEDGTYYKALFCSNGEQEVDMLYCCFIQTKNPCIPLSITMSKKGATPQVASGWWLPTGGGGANFRRGRKVGGIEYGHVFLEWILEFNMNPVGRCKWGRNVSSSGSPSRNDTDRSHEFVSGKTVYMYDSPGAVWGRWTRNFEVWAQAEDNSVTISHWSSADESGFTDYGTGKEPKWPSADIESSPIGVPSPAYGY